jgi:hypothetical protein
MVRVGGLIRSLAGATAAIGLLIGAAAGQTSRSETVEHPFDGITYITRTQTTPRAITMHVVLVDLNAAGLRFKVTPPSGARETTRQTTLDFLQAEQAQVAINGHFFLPFPSTDTEAVVIGLAASEGRVYSAFETPEQSYALIEDAPAINIDRSNRADIVHRDPRDATRAHVMEPVSLWNVLAGSAQIVTSGVKTIPRYMDAASPRELLSPGGPAAYSNSKSWYEQVNARTIIGLSGDARRLVLLVVERSSGSQGMSVGEAAGVLLDDYGVRDALNLDGGGSSTLAMEDPVTHVRTRVSRSSDEPNGRAVGSSLAVFARPVRAK